MENIITRTNEQFGSIRTIKGTPPLWCGSDVAAALGYAKPANAISKHCKGVTEIVTPTKGGNQKMKFIPEADVYRLICHSKLPKAQEFERWVFEDVVPEAVHPTPQEPECSYFDKTFGGQPVVTVSDAAQLTGAGRSLISYALTTDRYVKGEDYLKLSGKDIMAFKAENPRYPSHATSLIIITKSGFFKLIKELNVTVELPKLFLKAPEEPKEPMYEPSDAMVSLLNYIDRDIILITEYRRRLLVPCTLKEAEQCKKMLGKALNDLRYYHTDTETIRIESSRR